MMVSDTFSSYTIIINDIKISWGEYYEETIKEIFHSTANKFIFEYY